MKNVYIVVNHTVPTEHPNGVRVANLGLIFKEIGYQVTLVGFAAGSDRTSEYKGMRCVLFEERGGSGVMNAMQRERECLRKFKEFLLANEQPSLVISGLFNCKRQQFLMKYCAKNKIPFAETVCEWYDRSSFAGVKGFFKLINNRYSLRIQFSKAKNVIGISSLLCDYYDSRGCNTVYIPTLVDPEEYAGVTHTEGDCLRIAYAGSPARKDYVINAIRAVALLTDEERSRLQLHFYGPQPSQLRLLGLSDEFLDQYQDQIVCHGRIPYAEVKAKVADADFTVLLRPNKRYANAGFPTKVGESMACGTPVIANITSDLGKYIIDGKTGIVCADETPEACAEGFRRALAMSTEEKGRMRKAAYEMANTGFNYLSYVDDMREFLERLR